MGLFGFGGKDNNLVAVIFEGPGRLRLNGNRKKGKELEAAKKAIKHHEYTVCWIEFTQTGKPLDSGNGPSAAKVGSDEASKILRDLPYHQSCKEVLVELEKGGERSARILSWQDRNVEVKPT